MKSYSNHIPGNFIMLFFKMPLSESSLSITIFKFHSINFLYCVSFHFFPSLPFLHRFCPHHSFDYDIDFRTLKLVPNRQKTVKGQCENISQTIQNILQTEKKEKSNFNS